MTNPETNTSWKPNYWDDSVTPPDFVTSCKNCACEVRLQKDSLENKQAYCFDCSHLAVKELT